MTITAMTIVSTVVPRTLMARFLPMLAAMHSAMHSARPFGGAPAAGAFDVRADCLHSVPVASRFARTPSRPSSVSLARMNLKYSVKYLTS